MKIEILRRDGVYYWAAHYGEGCKRMKEGQGRCIEEVMFQVWEIKTLLETEEPIKEEEKLFCEHFMEK